MDEMRGLWSALSRGERDALAALGVRRRIAKGSVVFLEGDVAHDALPIRRGVVKVHDVARRARDRARRAGADDIVGELAPSINSPRSAARRRCRTWVVAIPSAVFVDFLERRGALPRAAGDGGAETTAVRPSSAPSMRLAHVRASSMAQRWGTVEGADILVHSPVSETDLAGWTGLSREAVVKSLRALRHLGWIENQGRDIRVHDLPSLQQRGSLTL
jgi:CRP-like cAMP-binding protein